MEALVLGLVIITTKPFTALTSKTICCRVLKVWMETLALLDHLYVNKSILPHNILKKCFICRERQEREVLRDLLALTDSP